jgi:parvulin-like peptidyl-prolyl isomerase
MNRLLVLSFLIFFLIQCSDDQLKKGTPLYKLAKELAQQVPELDPDSNKIWISTDDFKIRPSEIVPIMQERYGNQIASLKASSSAKMREMVLSLSRMIARNRIILQAAQEQNIYYSQVKFDSLMEIQINKWGGPERFKENFEKDGMKVEAIRETIKEGLIIEAYMDKVIPDSLSTVSDEDIILYYNNNQVTVRHIFLLTRGKSEDEKEQIHQKMEDILLKARSGEDFAQLAMAYSEDPETKRKGGYLQFGPGRTLPAFEETAFKLQVGMISDIVETPFGYHIIKVIDRKPEKQPLEKIHESYRRGLFRLKQQRGRYSHIEFLKEQVNYREYID